MSSKQFAAQKLGGRIWFNVILFGLMGQIAWNVENMFFNTFLCNDIYGKATAGAVSSTMPVTNAVAWMVGLSAFTAVVTTFLMGNLSDRLRNRKLFIAGGYVLWGVITGCFGFVSLDATARLFHLKEAAVILSATVWLIIALDCLMTFMGSTANDSAFNAWVTDVTDVSNRTHVETLLAALPVLAMGVVIGLGGVVIAKFGYPTFFFSLGAVVVLCGVIGFFSIREPAHAQRTVNTAYYKDLFYGFRPSVIKSNAQLYLTLAAVCIYSVSVQVFFPYIIVYLQHSDVALMDTISTVLTPVRLAALVVTAAVSAAFLVFFLKTVNRYGKTAFLIVAALLFIAGLTALSFAHTAFWFLLILLPALVGYAMLSIILNAMVRDYTPKDKAGLFQGVRMIFFVLIPMVIGPRLAILAAKNSTVTYVNDIGAVNVLPSAAMFLIAGITGALIFVPVAVLMKKEKSLNS